MLYVAFARRVKSPTRKAGLKLSFTAPNVIIAVSSNATFFKDYFPSAFLDGFNICVCFYIER